MDLFEYQGLKEKSAKSPLAERVRPKQLEDFFGQPHLTGPGTLLRTSIEKDQIFSMILWGPPGCGKTTLARIISYETKSYFAHFSAVLSGIKDIRQVIEQAIEKRNLYKKRTILFVDEIHRFNKAQQDAFLHHVESGLIVLVGATTENPSFEVISPLLSRCRVLRLNALTEESLSQIINRAITDKDNGLGQSHIKVEPDAMQTLIQMADGDARFALNGLELAAFIGEKKSEPGRTILTVTREKIEQALQKKALLYDKDGEEHYNLISAFHKSLRGSDPDAAIYWLARMILAGEDPLYIARRMVRFASEDIGNADPAALGIALRAKDAFHFLGHPEGETALAQAAIYLATAPKSNRTYVAYETVKKTIKDTGALPVPMHIRNAPTQLMKDIGYGKGYKYNHDYEDAIVDQDYLPDQLKDSIFYSPTQKGFENMIKKRMDWVKEIKNNT